MNKQKLPEGWKEVELGTLVNIKTGKLDANKQDKDGIYPFFTCSEKISRINVWAYDCECVLVAGNGDLNVKYYEGKFNAYQRTYIIETKNNEELFTKFLYYFLSKYVEVLRTNSIGGVIKYIKLGDLSGIKFHLPPVEIQKKIVTILEKIERAKDLRKKADDSTKDLLKSIYVDIFSDMKKYDVIELKDLVEEFRFGTSSKSGNKGYDVLGIPNVLGDDLILKDCNKVELTEKEYSNWRLLKKDMLFVRTNGNPNYIGRCGVFESNKENYVFASYLIRARIKKDLLNPYFLKTFLESPLGRKELFSKCRTTAGQYNINTQGLGSIKIPLPPINLQDEFEIRLKTNKELIEQQKHSKEQIDKLFNALLQKAFRGELYV